MLTPLFAILLIPPLISASALPSRSEPLVLHPIQKHSHSVVHLPSPLVFNSSTSSTLFTTSSPLAFELKTTRRTILKKRSAPSASALLLQQQQAFGWNSASAGSDDDDDLGWEEVEVDAPDLTDKDTVVNLARMANDAYASPGEARWMELDKFNLTLPFGWGEEDAGLRGHVFADSTNSTLVISIKGTSLDTPGSPKGGSTARLDRTNDNKLFSCCCGHLNPTSPNVCPCFLGGKINKEKKICDSSCVEMSLYDEDSYYVAAIALYAQVRILYPHAQIWLVGHSLGGVVSSLIGLTFGLPVVAFEAPPDRLAVRRLRLDMPHGTKAHYNPVTHIYHTGDVMAVGKCRGVLSLCGRGGYAMESECHQGNLIVYETVEKWGWNVDLTGRSHTIQYAIDNVYAIDWNNGEKEGPEGRGRDWTPVPDITFEKDDCSDCGDWTFLGGQTRRRRV